MQTSCPCPTTSREAARTKNYLEEGPDDLLQTLNSVAHLSEELSEKLGQRSIVYPVRRQPLHLRDSLRHVGLETSRDQARKQRSRRFERRERAPEPPQYGVRLLRRFRRRHAVRRATCYGILPHSRAIIMEDLRKYDRAPTFDLESGLKVVKTMATMHSHFRGAPLGRLSK